MTRNPNEDKPLSEPETKELSTALQRLAFEGVPVPKHLLRHFRTGDISAHRHYGHTLDAVPSALDRLGPSRDTVVVGFLRRFEQAVRDHHDQVKNRPSGTPLDNTILQRYFDVAFLLHAAKPKTEEGVIQVANFLLSEKDEVHAHAAEMLEGAPYFPIIIDRLFENISVYSIRQWPNRQSRTLASFAHIPSVRHRLMNAFHSEEDQLRHMAVMAFGFLKQHAGRDAEAELFAIAENDADELQGAALRALREICPSGEKLRHLALRLIRSDKFWVRGGSIWCLEEFHDEECIEALLSALSDEGGHDFDNAGDAAKFLMKRSLNPEKVLAPLMAILRILLAREDKRDEEPAGFRAGIQKLAEAFKAAAEARGDSTEGVGVVSFASPETLLAVARILSRLGPAASPAIPLIESCIQRAYVSGASDEGDWREIRRAIDPRSTQVCE